VLFLPLLSRTYNPSFAGLPRSSISCSHGHAWQAFPQTPISVVPFLGPTRDAMSRYLTFDRFHLYFSKSSIRPGRAELRLGPILAYFFHIPWCFLCRVLVYSLTCASLLPLFPFSSASPALSMFSPIISPLLGNFPIQPSSTWDLRMVTVILHLPSWNRRSRASLARFG
jgi:hypothetical protein